jgi:hypothetical protein
MSIALRNFQGIHTPIQRIQEDSNLRMLLVICGLITAPSLVLVVFLTGWVQYVFALVLAINVAVPVMAYFASLNPPRPLPDEDYAMSRGPQAALGGAELPLSQQVPAEKISDKV